MIPFDFEYYAPGSLEQAVELFSALEAEQKQPLYYSGGTEIVTLCRHQVIKPGALIDIKKIPETIMLEPDGDRLVFGANLTLSTLSEQDYFPLLSSVARRIADRTVRNRLTLGGNICGRLPYRETVLPFLLAEAEVVLVDPRGRRVEKLDNLFEKRLHLKPGQMLIQLIVSRTGLESRSWRKRRERHGPVDYPLCHLVAMKVNGRIAAAVSGLCAFPFRSKRLDDLLNDPSMTAHEKAENSLKELPAAIRNDERASAAYRKALWIKDLTAMVREMEGKS